MKGVAVVLVLVVLLLGWLLLRLYDKKGECNSGDGVMVQTIDGWDCLRGGDWE